MVLALHARKRERFTGDAELYELYRRVVVERADIVAAYSRSMTKLAAQIIADGVEKGEYRLDDVCAAASVLRQAVTVLVHPAYVEATVKADLSIEPMMRNVVRGLVAAFRGRSLGNRALNICHSGSLVGMVTMIGILPH